MPVEAEIRQQPLQSAPVTEKIAPSPEMTQRVAMLVNTAARLNAGPAVTEQRRIASRLSSRALPIQRMEAPPAEGEGEIEGGDLEGAPQGGQQDDEIEWGDFQQAQPQEQGEQDWVPNFPPPAPPEIEVGIGESELSQGPMFTRQLANCTAIVAYSAATGNARLYHWNTIAAFDRELVDEDDHSDDEDAERMLVPRAAEFEEAQGVVDAGVGGGIVYHIVMGLAWGSADVTPRSKQNFHQQLAGTFGGATIDQTGYSNARWADHALTGY